MNFLKRLIIALAVFSLTLWLYFAVTAFSVANTAANPTYVKSLLVKSGVYKNIVNDALTLAETQNMNDPEASTNQIEQLKPVIQKTLTPEFLQSTTEAIITGTYHWLDGSAKEPDFSVQAAPIREKLSTEITDYLYNRTLDLPLCTRGAIINDDPFTATCKPTATVTKQDFAPNVEKFVADLPLLKTDTITFATLTTDADANVAKKELPTAVPIAYKWLKLSPYLILALAAVSVVIIVLVKRDMLSSSKTIGHTFLVTGILLVVTSVFSLVILANSAVPINSGNEQQKTFILDILTPLSKNLGTTISNYTLYFGVAYVGIAALCYFVGIHIKKSRHIEADEKNETVNSNGTPTEKTKEPENSNTEEK